MTSRDPHQQMMIYFQQSGLFPTIFVYGFKVYPSLISTRIECLRPETHTFHVPSAEATITLEDVAYQLGVPMNGAAIVRHNNYNPIVKVHEVLEKLPPYEVMDDYRIRMAWLEFEFQVTDDSTDKEVIFASQEYLLQLIGGVLLPDKFDNLAHT
ncbi:serine/threonine-protein phosphatase 7 long form homolog [Hibiscus syriacus]|uniref:serine/threonine-protein phosphatase 7 long form homolog n=1 Tax=Hibiscus syriacus TaxID=106335 RepID=UPI001923C273|nr:serine/threonine-protein phosphatase 7 long form homolog [Hibiscus syriacus]